MLNRVILIAGAILLVGVASLSSEGGIARALACRVDFPHAVVAGVTFHVEVYQCLQVPSSYFEGVSHTIMFTHGSVHAAATVPRVGTLEWGLIDAWVILPGGPGRIDSTMTR